METREISIDQIDEPSYDVRSWISREALEEMAESIAAVGVLVPLRVFERNGRYEIEDGHRRYLAAIMAGLQFVPCMIIPDEESRREIHKLHANLHSEHLTPIETSRTLHYLKDTYGYNHEDLAKMMGRSTSRVSQLLGLLNMDPNLVKAMEDRVIGEAHARHLQRIPDPDRRTYYIHYIKDGGASVDMVRSWVEQERVWAEAPEKPPDLSTVERPDVVIQPPLGRCRCCRKDIVRDALMILHICPDCYQDVLEVLPSIYKAIKMEKEGGEAQETEKIEDEGYT